LRVSSERVARLPQSDVALANVLGTSRCLAAHLADWNDLTSGISLQNRFVRHGLEPLGRGIQVHGEMSAGRVRRSAVPVLFSWLDHDSVARANVLGRLAPFLDANAAANYQKPLGTRVTMPVSPSARIEFDAVNVDRNPAHIRCHLYRSHAAGKAPRVDSYGLRVLTSK